MSNNSENNKRPTHNAYTMREGKDNQRFWTKVGAAWPSKEDGLTIKLDATPVDGVVHVRSIEYLKKIRAEKQAQQGQEQTQERKQKQDL